MAGLEECADALTELAGGGLPLKPLRARAGEILEGHWGRLDDREQQALRGWLQDRCIEVGMTGLKIEFRGRMAAVAEAALAEITKLLQAERKA